jgi:hypothetical protein
MFPFYPRADVNIIPSFHMFASVIDVREVLMAGFTSLSLSSSEDEPEEEEDRLNAEF